VAEVSIALVPLKAEVERVVFLPYDQRTGVLATRREAFQRSIPLRPLPTGSVERCCLQPAPSGGAHCRRNPARAAQQESWKSLGDDQLDQEPRLPGAPVKKLCSLRTCTPSSCSFRRTCSNSRCPRSNPSISALFESGKNGSIGRACWGYGARSNPRFTLCGTGAAAAPIADARKCRRCMMYREHSIELRSAVIR
jgi:hypothetical protein